MSGLNDTTRRESVGPGAMMHRQGGAQGSGGPPSGVGGDDALQPSAPSLVVADSLEFKVSYTLGEYVAFMWQHSARLIRRRRITGLAGWWMTFKTTWHAALNFIMLRRSRQLYEFTIDPHGIIRTGSAGVTLVPWSDVSAIRRYSRGYMMVLQRGTLPIPYRCLNETQRQTMDRFVSAVRQATRH